MYQVKSPRYNQGYFQWFQYFESLFEFLNNFVFNVCQLRHQNPGPIVYVYRFDLDIERC